MIRWQSVMRPMVRVNLSSAKLSRVISRTSVVLRSAAFSTFSRSNFASLDHVTAFTADKYPDLQRNSSFKKVCGSDQSNFCLSNDFCGLTPLLSQLSEDDIAYFRSVLSPSSLFQDEEDLEVFNNDWLQKYRGQSKLVLKPSSTEQVSKILKYCNDNK